MLSKSIRSVLRSFGTKIQVTESLVNLEEKYELLRKIEENAYVDYKVYPRLPHQDPNSPEYVRAELDEYQDSIEVKAYNEIINNLKHDLKVQRQVWDAIAKLDRPYKRGIRGIDTNLNPNGPTPLELPDLGFERYIQYGVPQYFRNEDRFIGNTPWHYKDKFTNWIEWEKQRLNRPVTKNYQQVKGSKYDVPIKPEQKYEYVADRLGHPQFLGTPLERLLKLEKDIYHPCYIDQPFIKTPEPGPHPSLNFEQGEVLYENQRVLEWIRAFQIGGVVGLAYGGVYLPLNMGYKTNLVTDKADQVVGGLYHLVSPHHVDLLKLFIPITTVAVYYLIYIAMRIIQNYGGQYAIKVSYSKDRELLFVKRVDTYGRVEEDVYETAHLEIVPPNQRAGVQDMSAQDEDGLWRITCLNTDNTILLYNDPKHWNKKLKNEFLFSKMNLWDKSYYGFNRPEQAEVDRKWKEEAANLIKQDVLPSN